MISRRLAAASTWKMRIGDLLDYEGKRYILRGLDPMGVPERRADLEDAETGEPIRVAIAEGGKDGMVTFDQSLLKLLRSGRISQDDAIAYADSPTDLRL